eukprot:gnl/TRDRNA2_/TRDRNA2_179957_c0_seq1.p1 gnl/TRDRNA2_/TRDRNA2_179957_c0~~gnl/TRDRNA2_/TRDRNA2_179957_c0_seq1.p1  ORF type:complete len:119 (+),score=22.52 gnl/TRDRNA2_/TRDRNA2_179957_c0_seq1:107-463(+)
MLRLEHLVVGISIVLTLVEAGGRTQKEVAAGQWLAADGYPALSWLDAGVRASVLEAALALGVCISLTVLGTALKVWQESGRQRPMAAPMEDMVAAARSVETSGKVAVDGSDEQRDRGL